MRQHVVADLVSQGEVEKPKPGDLRAALENALEQHPVSWVKENLNIDEYDLGEAEAEELEDVVFAVVSDLKAVLRNRRSRRDQSRGRAPSWQTGYSPDWWDSEVARLFANLTNLQDKALLLIRGGEAESREYMQPQQVRKVLDGIAEWDLLPGEQMTLDVPTGFYDHSPLLTYATVTFTGGEGGRGRVPNRLRRLAEIAEQVQYATGCRLWEALGFLLCNEVPYVPALQIEVGRPPGSIQIIVRHPEISLQVINDGIKAARKELGVEHGRPPDLRTGWPSVVYEFVMQWSKENPGRLDWPRIHDLFAARNPDAPYVRGKNIFEREGLDSLRETLYQERRRRELRGAK